MGISITFTFVTVGFISFYPLTKISKMHNVFVFAYLVTVVLSYPATEEGSGLIDESSGFMPAESNQLDELPCMRSRRDDVEASGSDASVTIGTIQVVSQQNTNEVKNFTQETLTPTCKGFELCYGDEDCHGGRCFGAFVGRCNCNACLNFWRCEEDVACGGLKGACNTTLNTCDCFQGYRQAGYPQYIDALRKLCNQKVCTKKSAMEECHGLPCNSGRCVC